MSARHRKKSPNRPANTAAVSMRRTLVLRVEALEITVGTDGLFRGKPEPGIVLAAYRAGTAPIALVGRSVCKAGVPGNAPIECKLPDDSGLRYNSRVQPGERFVILATALELDSERGLAALAAGLERTNGIELWIAGDEVPAPSSLTEFSARSFRAPEPAVVEVMIDSRPVAEIVRGDDFVSSAAFVLDARESHDESWRVQFADAQRRNVWCATVRAGLR